MIKQTCMTILVSMLGCALLLGGTCVQAQSITFLDMTVSPGSQIAAPGASPFWDVQLTNNNTDTAFFIFTGFSDGLGSVPGVTVPSYDPGPFGQQFTLAPNATVTLPKLFQTTILPSASSAIYNSTAFTVYDLYDNGSFNNLFVGGVSASGDWTLQVQARTAAVPEPGGFAFLAATAVTGGVLFLRRRRKG